ncbi:MAG: hypothetical protein RMJ36_02810 [Candidatus Calescibacterium sp.]|nr:hypothetical protein [Candidatus Calescibacterium sp.]MDW8132570.1 hypothetical protein [Candidatus Calescibacterium sp.]
MLLKIITLILIICICSISTSFSYIMIDNTFGKNDYTLRIKYSGFEKRGKIKCVDVFFSSYILDSGFGYKNSLFFPVGFDKNDNMIIPNAGADSISFFRIDSNGNVNQSVVNIDNSAVHQISYPYFVGSYQNSEGYGILLGKLRNVGANFELDFYKKIDISKYIENYYYTTIVGFRKLFDSFFIVGNTVMRGKNDIDILLLKLGFNGDLYKSYNDKGFLRLDNLAGGMENDGVFSFQTDKDGNMYFVGFSKSGNHCKDMLLVKLDNSGYLDKSFGNNGIVLINNVAGGNGVDLLSDIKIKNDYLIVGGISYDKNSIGRPVIMKMYKGKLDYSFGDYGIKIIPCVNHGQVLKVCIDEMGYIYSCVFNFSSSNPEYELDKPLKVVQMDQNGRIIDEVEMFFDEPTVLLSMLIKGKKLYIPVIQSNSSGYSLKVFRFYIGDKNVDH